MKMPVSDEIRNNHNYQTNRQSENEVHYPTFREIYESINHRDDFNEPQLFFLSRLVDRKLKAFDPRLNADDFEAKPYRTTCRQDTGP